MNDMYSVIDNHDIGGARRESVIDAIIVVYIENLPLNRTFALSGRISLTTVTQGAAPFGRLPLRYGLIAPSGRFPLRTDYSLLTTNY